MANKNLNKAKEAKKDEFYTQLEDINNELKHYREHFRGNIEFEEPWRSEYLKGYMALLISNVGRSTLA